LRESHGAHSHINIQTPGCSLFGIKLDLACCLSAAALSGRLAVMATMPYDVTLPNFSRCGSHGWSALPQPELVFRQNGNRYHLSLCQCLNTCAAPFYVIIY